MDKEQEIRFHFLEEAQEYLDQIELGLLGLESGKLAPQEVDGMLRAAHSLKGGAAMMGFMVLSEFAHRLEDSFKVLKIGKIETNPQELERLLLTSIDHLRQIVFSHRQGQPLDEIRLETEIKPTFEQLYQILGEPKPEDEAMLLSSDVSEDLNSLIFSTEVENYLQQLTELLEQPKQASFVEDWNNLIHELAGLAEMLELPAFSSLCASITEQVEQNPDIANYALQELQRSQALVLTQQIHLLPSSLISSSDLEIETKQPELSIEEHELGFENLVLHNLEEPTFENLEATNFLEIPSFEPTALDFLSNLDLEVTPEVTETPILEVAPVQITPETISKTTAPPSDETLIQAPSVSEKTIRVPLRQLEQLSDLFGQLTIERNSLNLQLNSLSNLLKLLQQRTQILEKSNFQLRTAYDKLAIATPLTPNPLVTTTSSTLSQFDILEFDRYSDLNLMSQEVMETIVQLQEVSTDLNLNLEETERTNRGLNRTAKQMQSNLTQIRMRPLGDLTARFPRALRDLELQYGKKVNLKIKGSSTLIDRNILEALNDPLLHLLRNAFDHGIEDIATRRNLNKPETGLIEIAANYRGNKTIITIRDDGRGIDTEKIKAKALKMGLSEADLKQASNQDLLELIFEPGFSTASQVTDLSGRGVGMDVVRTNLRQIRGEIQVDTKPGQGTTFTITVPFTLSVVKVLLVESQGMLLAFPSNAVEEILLLQPEMLINSVGQQILNWEGFMLHLIQLSQWLNFARPPQNSSIEGIPLINQPVILIIAQGDDLVGIQVDRYWEEQEVTIRQVEGELKMPPGFVGCTILGNGRVVPLIDALSLLRWIEEQQGQFKPHLRANLTISESEPPENIIPEATIPQKSTIMVIDDSINVRRFLALTLKKAGYRVEQAKDGQEAIEKLKTDITINAIICDIEMPRLDGYGFLAHIKSDPNHKHIPVMMLTSRSGAKYRQMAFNLGANGYLSKPFKEPELLQTLETLIT